MEKTIPTEVEYNADFVLDPSKLTDADMNSDVVDTDATEDSGFDLGSLVLKHNGKEIKASELSKDDLIANLQKGMNYDHILAERDQFKNAEELSIIRELAKEDGKEIKQYLSDLKASRQQQKIETRAKELEAEGYKPEHALKTAEMEMKLKAVEPNKPSSTEAYQKDFETLLTSFPEAKEFKEFNDFPDAVKKAITEGTSPVVAYAKYKVDQAEAQKLKLVQEADAKARTTPSLTDSQTKEDKDEFRTALFSK